MSPVALPYAKAAALLALVFFSDNPSLSLLFNFSLIIGLRLGAKNTRQLYV